MMQDRRVSSKRASSKSSNREIAQCKVEELLKKSPFFRELSQTVQDKLPSIVHRSTEKAGAVLFQEGDPPGDCYILLSGEAAVWKKGYEVEKEELSSTSSSVSTQCPSSPSSLDSAWGPASQEDDTRRRSSAWNHRGSHGEGCCPDSNQSAPGNRRKGAAGVGFDRQQFYALAFGAPVCTLGSGAIFGELALMRNQPRSATIICVGECDLFVIKRADFDAVMKVELTKLNEVKRAFLLDHLPGMKDLTPHRISKSLYLFNKVTFPKGHAFLAQGVTSNSCIYVLTRGTVSISRREGKTCEERSCSPSHRVNPSRQLRELMKGSVFGSCVAHSPEPFSCIATSECEVLYCDSDSLDEMPFGIYYAVRDHLALMMLRRLEQCGTEQAGDASPIGSMLQKKASRSRLLSKSACNLSKAACLSRACLQSIRQREGSSDVLGLLHSPSRSVTARREVARQEAWAETSKAKSVRGSLGGTTGSDVVKSRVAPVPQRPPGRKSASTPALSRCRVHTKRHDGLAW